MTRISVLTTLLSLVLLAGLTACSGESNEGQTSSDEQTAAVETSDSGFRPLFDGETLDGWKRHENLPGEQNSGGKWEVVDGAIVGDQDPPGHGGFLITTEKYENFEVKMESKLDYPVDSGIFLRVGETGESHQITLDYRPEGTVGAVYMALLHGFVDKVNVKEKFKRGEWNDLRARIEGHPAHIQFWLNGEKVTDFQHTEETSRGAPERGYLGVQVHGGDTYEEGKKVRFRNIMIKELD